MAHSRNKCLGFILLTRQFIYQIIYKLSLTIQANNRKNSHALHSFAIFPMLGKTAT